MELIWLMRPQEGGHSSPSWKTAGLSPSRPPWSDLIGWAGVGVGRKDPARHRITALGGTREITVHCAQAPAQPRSGATWIARVLPGTRPRASRAWKGSVGPLRALPVRGCTEPLLTSKLVPEAGTPFQLTLPGFGWEPSP